MSNPAIHIENLCFSYEKAMVLKRLSMDIEQGRICFVMGNNGSGKTTLLKNLMGFLVPQLGEIQIQGKPIASLDRQVMSKLISYVPQAIHLNTDFTVVDYLSLGRTPYTGFSSKLSDEDYDIIERYSVMLGVDLIYDIPFNKLSGGQKQIVAIARSLIQDTPLIIMDEPMSALDLGKQMEVLKILGDLTIQGKTIVLTTHNPNHALAVDSNACFLQQGELVALGESCSVVREDILQQVYGDFIRLDHGEKMDFVGFASLSNM